MLDRPFAHRGPEIAEQADQLVRRTLFDVKRQATWIDHSLGPDPADPVNRAEGLGLGLGIPRESIREPAPHVDEQHAAIGILEHVGDPHVMSRACEEVRVNGAKCGTVANQLVAHDLVEHVLGREKTVLEFWSERAASDSE